MNTFIISAYFERDLSEKEKSQIKKNISLFAYQITGVPQSEHNVEIKTGSWEIILTFMVPVGIWVFDKLVTYFLEKKMDKLMEDSKSTNENNKTDKILETSTSNQSSQIPSDLDKIFEFIQKFNNEHPKSKITFAMLSDDEKGKIVKVNPENADGGVDITYIQTENKNHFDEIISEK